ncbi:MAG: hypothetical protein IPK13_12360 [Deltaproteobacteria bacterium]|nr:hypothetical protein [Deltaproteobacteria bacterium]
MRARYAISNIAAIGRPGRCGPVSYMLEVALRRSGSSGSGFGLGGSEHGPLSDLSDLVDVGGVGGLGGGVGADFDPNMIPGVGGGTADFELDPSVVPGLGPDVGPDQPPEVPPDLDPGSVAGDGTPSVPDCGRPWLTRPSSGFGHGAGGVGAGAGGRGVGGAGSDARPPPGFDPPTGSMDLTCVPIAIFEPGTHATPANLCPAPFGPAR